MIGAVVGAPTIPIAQQLNVMKKEMALMTMTINTLVENLNELRHDEKYFCMYRKDERNSSQDVV